MLRRNSGTATSAKLEYLHIDLGTDTVTFNTFTTVAPIVPVTSHTTTAKLCDEIVRLGLNYEFREHDRQLGRQLDLSKFEAPTRPSLTEFLNMKRQRR